MSGSGARTRAARSIRFREMDHLAKSAAPTEDCGADVITTGISIAPCGFATGSRPIRGMDVSVFASS